MLNKMFKLELRQKSQILHMYYYQVKKPKREQIMQPIQPKQEPVTHHEIDMSESVGIGKPKF